MEMPDSPIKKFSRRYVRPSFVEGMARMWDLGGSLNSYTAEDFEQLYRELRARRLARPTGPEAEARAIHNCWLKVGNHLRDAMGMPRVQIQDAVHWSDLIPSPAVLQEYDAILPGAAERIMAMAEKRQQYQLAQEKELLAQEQYDLETDRRTHTNDSRKSILGLISAFVFALAGMGAGVYLIDAGFGGYALACLIAPWAILSGMFVYQIRVGRRRRKPAGG